MDETKPRRAAARVRTGSGRGRRRPARGRCRVFASGKAARGARSGMLNP